MPNQKWTDRISAMTASSQKSSQSLNQGRWKISIGEINWENCTWFTIKKAILRNPLEDFIVWYKEDSTWEKVVSTHIDFQCACGRPWVEKNNTIFAFRGDFYRSPSSFEEQIGWLSAPLKCKFCYYQEQYKKGNWVPKDVLKQLGLNAK